jgi:predicted ATPase
LEEELREILSVASVEGKDFTAQVVARVQEVGERKLLRSLSQELEKRHRLVREGGRLTVGNQRLSRYRFAHTLFQQFLYNDLSPGECRLLHGEIAELLEELYEGHTEEFAVQLARHYSAAGDEGRALKYSTLAGDIALASYANQEAEDHHRRGLELGPTEAQRAHVLSGLGQALSRQSRFAEAIEIWREGIELHQALGDSDGVARLYARSARAAWWSGEPTECTRLSEEGLAVVSGEPESVEMARLLHEAARATRSTRCRKKLCPYASER